MGWANSNSSEFERTNGELMLLICETGPSSPLTFILARTGCASIHPAGLRAAVLLVSPGIFRWNVIAMLVEFYGAVVLAHIDLEFPRRPAPLPAIVLVAYPIKPLREAKRSPAG